MDKDIAAFDDNVELATTVATPAVVNDDFTKSVATYFSSYLDGGLSPLAVPQRSSQHHYFEGLLRSVYVDSYPQLNKNLYKNFITGLSQKTFVITQNKYTSHSDDHVLSLFAKDINGLSQDKLDAFLQCVTHAIDAIRLNNETFNADALNAMFAETIALTKSELIIPLLTTLQNALEPSTELRKWLLRVEHDAADRLFDAFAVSLEQIFTSYVRNNESVPSLFATLKEQLPLNEVRYTLGNYVDEAHVGDAYQHVYSLHRTSQVSKLTSLNIYFAELTISNHKFPVFYSPLSTTHTYPSVTVNFENRIFVNKDALAFAARLFSAQTGLNVDIPDFPDVLFSDTTTTQEDLQRILDDIAAAFALDGSISLAQPNEQTVRNEVLSLSNSLLFYAAPADTKSLRTAYDILQSDDKVFAAANQYIQSLVTETKPRYIEEIAESWDSMTAIEKLLPTNPLSTNDEQKQVLAALTKPNCDIIIVEGASGTGKSHLTKSATLQALSAKQSVLVVSNTATATNDLHSSIETILADGTGAKTTGHHNPVLNLAKLQQLESFDEQYIETVQKQVTLHDTKASELSTAKKRKVQDATEMLANVTQNAENINLHEVEQTVFNERRFAGRNWIDDEPIDSISSDIQRIHRAIQYVRGSEASYLLPYIEVSQQRAIDEFIDIFKEYEKANKNVNTRLPEFIVRYRKLLPEQKKALQSSLAYIQSNYRQFIKILKGNEASKWLAITDNTNFDQLERQETILQKLSDITKHAQKLLKRHSSESAIILQELQSYSADPQEIVAALTNYIEQVAALKSKLFGFSGRTLVVENLNKQLIKSLPEYHIPEPEKQVDTLALMSELVQLISQQLAASGLQVHYWKDVVYMLQSQPEKLSETAQIIAALNAPNTYEFMSEFHIYETDNLIANIALLHFATELNRVFKEHPNFAKLFGITAIGHLLARPQEFSSRINKLSGDLNEAAQLDEAKQTIKKFIKDYPAASKRIGISIAGGNLEVLEETFANSDPEFVKEYLSHKKKEQDIRSYFDEVIHDSFSKNIREIEQILGIELQHTSAKRMLGYVLQNSAQFANIKKDLQDNKQLTAKQLQDTLKAFPCISGDIASVAQSIPLVAQSFDLIIVENASMITIAELLPIALRAKKLLLIGDSKQQKNIQIRISAHLDAMHKRAMNNALRGILESLPADSKNAIIAKVQQTFTANYSSLTFFKEYAGFHKTLQKQYGSYGEIISFADKYYYDDSLQSITSRARPLVDVLKFTEAEPTSSDAGMFTNAAEVRTIIDELTVLKDSDYKGTIGIIAPFAEQAALLQKELDETVINDWYQRRNLKVMTFDTCQDETRDYIFYSMTASKQYDKLAQKFAGDITIKAYDEDIRSERLLAGITRATKTMHFITSQSVDEFAGSVRNVLTHYQTKLQGTNVPVKGTTTDILLPTETNITQAFEKSKFAKRHADKVTFIAKYNFTDYARMLSPKYQKAAYKMYFLVSFEDQSIVIEYDDFKERFLQSENGAKDSAPIYLTPQDVYGQKVLEGYNYRFLRLNKFNLGSDPSKTLDKYLSEIIKQPSWPSDNGFVFSK